jgi:hypothetical protein
MTVGIAVATTVAKPFGLISVAGWIVLQMFFNSSGCHGPVQFRL